jgi:hypothetical protein
VFISFFSQKRNEPKKKVVAALFSIKVSAVANVVLPENQEAKMKNSIYGFVVLLDRKFITHSRGE